MANDKDWQRRTDEWVKAMNESRLKKERNLALQVARKNIEICKK